MRKLLYLPTSKYINCEMILEHKGRTLVEDVDIFETRPRFLERLVAGEFLSCFYKRHNLELPLSLKEFEVVEVEESTNEKTTLPLDR